MTTPYDLLRYKTCARRQTHPDRLAAVARLFGMEAAPLETCRVLEIGCGDGNNLIPMAYGLPGAHFTGVDVAEKPVAEGCRQAEALGLANLSLHAMDLRDVGAEFGEFDYIIAHGIYSWIPADVRDALLAVCGERLAPYGLAFVSYNAYPGRHLRQMLGEMTRYATRAVDQECKVERGRDFLRFLGGQTLSSESWRLTLASEIEEVLTRGQAGFFHDDLAEINQPVYLCQFAAHAARHRLQYVGDADLHVMFDQSSALDGMDLDYLEREQYLDFLRMRRFRQTILCREGVALCREPSPELMQQFLFSAPARVVDEHLEGTGGIRLSSNDERVNRVAQALGDAYPLPVGYEDLLPYAEPPEALREILFALVTNGFASLHVFEFPCEESVSARPRASRLARLQALTSNQVANACHTMVELDEIGRNLLLLLDGTRDHRTIARDLAAMPDSPPEEEIARHLPSSLEWMGRMALLEG